MAGLFFLASLAMKGAVNGVGAVKNYKERTTRTYPLGKYTDERYYYDIHGHAKLCSNNHPIMQDTGKWVDLSYCPPITIYDEFEEIAEHNQKMIEQNETKEKRSVYLKVNPRTYPFGAPSFFETKTGKQIALLKCDCSYKPPKYFLGYFDESQKGGIYRVDRDKFDWETRHEISGEYYDELNRDIEELSKDAPKEWYLTLAYKFY